MYREATPSRALHVVSEYYNLNTPAASFASRCGDTGMLSNAISHQNKSLPAIGNTPLNIGLTQRLLKYGKIKVE